MRKAVLMMLVVGVAAIGLTLVRAQAQSPSAIAVVRDPGCGCCLQWVAHLQKAGFKVTVTESAEMDTVKDTRGVPKGARSCHTATVGRYVLEGHVPVREVQRLLSEKPDVVGLAVPGMPIGSPGMEVAGMGVQRYDVLAFDKAGRTRVFASYGR